MLSEEEIKKIINRTDTVEGGYKLELIQQHILDVKNVKVIINKPSNAIDMLLMEQAYNISLGYYKNKYK